jgi:alkylated DNA repair dioxygenase AlkB
MHLFPLQLDPADIPAIPGLELLPGYIDEEAERELIAAIDREPWDTTWQRRRQLYGHSYGPGEQETPPIPGWGQNLADRLLREGLADLALDQMLVNEYLPGQGISLHRDYSTFENRVFSLSLLSACVMDFQHASTGARASLLLPRRSLLILRDEARQAWQHGIAARKKDRWQGLAIPRQRRLSITFRSRKAHDRPRTTAAGRGRE